MPRTRLAIVSSFALLMSSAALADDPPPHEGAMIDVPITIEPPDILVVEVLQALPGRDIRGEHLIRPDGTISLGFYGDVYVRGLTLPQAKVKIILHLRKYLSGQILGLTRFESDADHLMPGLPDLPGAKPAPRPQLPPLPTAPGPEPASRPQSPAPTTNRGNAGPPPGLALNAGVNQPDRQEPPNPFDPVQIPKAVVPLEDLPDEMNPFEVAGKFVDVKPEDSTRVFVDIASYNSKFYYVQGDVHSPGRMPFTGRETVLDAIQYGGGLASSAEPNNVHLYRPGRNGKPPRDYRIHLDAISKGVESANLQMLPGDRLFVGRNAVVQKTFESDLENALKRSQANKLP